MTITNLNDIDTLAEKGCRKLEAEKPQLIFGLATCGIAAGGKDLKDLAQDYLAKKDFDAGIVSVGCIGMCHAEPLVDVKLPGKPRVTYANVTPERLQKIIDRHLIGGEAQVDYALGQLSGELSSCRYGALKFDEKYPGIPTYKELPFFSKQLRIALRNCGILNPESIEEYIFRGGYRAAFKTLRGMTPQDVIEEMKTSEIRGRGGAGFPTGLKWQFARNAKGDQKYIICNADEGDPGAYMDRAVLEGDPHSIIEGMLIGGYAMGATIGYLYVRAEYPLAIKRLKMAIAQAEENGILGDGVMGSGFSFRLRIMEGAGAFVCGEETALIASIEGKRGEPRPRPPFPANKGLFGKPTNVNNVETLANVAMILDKGGAWFASIGTGRSKGTKVFSLVGKVDRAGLVEIPMGTTLKEIIYDIGGGIPNERNFKAVQTGGPSGGCIPMHKLDVGVDYENLKALGSIVGSGGMVVMDEDTCMVDVARYFLAFSSEESCGQCTPCRVGTQRMLEILERITTGLGKEGDIGALEHLAIQVRDGSLCALGGTAPNPVLTTLKYFRNEYEEHIKQGRCNAAVCASLFISPCQNTCPAGTNVPGFIQYIKEKRFGEAYELNREDNPLPSVCGRICDHPCEMRCQRAQIDDPLNIWALKRYCSDKVLLGEGGVQPAITRLQDVGKKVAIVGGGPSGISAAYFLRRLGYHVTLFEESDRLGGMLRYGIPNYRLPHDILDKEIQDVIDLGIDVYYKTAIGQDLKLTWMVNAFDAIYLAVGAWDDITLDLEGKDLPGMLNGLEALEKITDGKPVVLGKTVLVIGGGNVSVDVARSALRLGCEEVTICYRREKQDMPAYPEEISEAIEEGIKFNFLAAPERLIVEDGQVVGAVFRKMVMGEHDKWGRRRPEPTDEFMEVRANTIVTAIGQSINPGFLDGFSKELETNKGRIITDTDSLVTSHPRIFAGGDAVLGPATAIEAIAQGKAAAIHMDKALSGSFRYIQLREMSNLDKVEMEEPNNTEPMERQEPPMLPYGERTCNFSEVILCMDDECAHKEATRCMRCDVRSKKQDHLFSFRHQEGV